MQKKAYCVLVECSIRGNVFLIVSTVRFPKMACQESEGKHPGLYILIQLVLILWYMEYAKLLIWEIAGFKAGGDKKNSYPFKNWDVGNFPLHISRWVKLTQLYLNRIGLRSPYFGMIKVYFAVFFAGLIFAHFT